MVATVMRTLAVVGAPRQGPVTVLTGKPVESYFAGTYAAALTRQGGASYEFVGGIFQLKESFSLADLLAQPQVSPGYPLRVVVTNEAIEAAVTEAKREHPDLNIVIYRI